MKKTTIRRVVSYAITLPLVHAATLGTVGVAGASETALETLSADVDVRAADIVDVSLAERDIVGGQLLVVKPMLQFMFAHFAVLGLELNPGSESVPSVTLGKTVTAFPSLPIGACSRVCEGAL